MQKIKGDKCCNSDQFPDEMMAHYCLFVVIEGNVDNVAPVCIQSEMSVKQGDYFICCVI